MTIKAEVRHVQRFRDRHGKWRTYLRKRGYPRIPLPADIESAEFFGAYAAALAAGPIKQSIGASRTKQGTISALIAAYYGSQDYKSLAPLTRSTYRNIIERFRNECGELPVERLEGQHVKKMVNARAKTPSAANHFLDMITVLMRFAIAENWRKDDPTAFVKKLKQKSGGYHTWTEDEIAAFEKRHSVGTKARLALDLLQWTGQRRSDVVKLGPGNIVRLDGEDWIRLTQEKTGTTLDLPIHPALAASLAAVPITGSKTFLVTEWGRPFTAAGFGNWFRDRCNEAGLAHCSAHGLRKTLATRIANAQGTGHQVKAWTGHRNLAEVDTYTRAADQRRLAREAFNKLTKIGK